VTEHVEVRKAQVKAQTEAALARQKQEHDLVGEARKQEVVGHYEGQRARQTLEHEGQRENLRQRSAAVQSNAKAEATERAGEAKVKATEAAGSMKPTPKADAGGDVAARLEKQFAAMAKAMQALGDSIKKVDEGNRQHRAVVANELQRVRQTREQRAKPK
jgi:hypothetical protein